MSTSERIKGLYKYRDSKNWWLRYTDPISGKRKAVSLGTDDEGDAVHRAHVILGGHLLEVKAGIIDREIDDYLVEAQETGKEPDVTRVSQDRPVCSEIFRQGIKGQLALRHQ